MVSKLHPRPPLAEPLFDETDFRSESDVEQKFLYPFMVSPSYLGIPKSWVRTKEYMVPTEIDKLAGKRRGYVPDYSIWKGGLPVLIIEAKDTDISVEVGLREARLYALEINKRYPSGLNPISYVLASNGIDIAVSPWDSEIDTFSVKINDLRIGSSALEVFRNTVGFEPLASRADKLQGRFQRRAFTRTSLFMGGQNVLSVQLGYNEFAEPLFPILAQYFASNSDDIPDIVIDRAYVSSDEIGSYEGVLNTYLKDRLGLPRNQLTPIETSRNSANQITGHINVFSSNPSFYSRVQLIVGSVGSGKSTFVRRYYRRLMTPEVNQRTRWAFINFNLVRPPGRPLGDWICEQFIESLSKENDIDIETAEAVEKLYAPEIKRFENGPAKALRTALPDEFARRRFELIDNLEHNPEAKVRSISRRVSGEMGLGIVVNFDNVDKRSRDEQLAIFEAAQWFKDLTRGLILVNLRDSTFEAHREEPPLDAFSNAINFYIRPPRFAQVIRKRLELVFEYITQGVEETLRFTTEGGLSFRYPSSRLGEFLMGIYISLFAGRSRHITVILEGLVSKDVRRALGMFGDVLVSPHISIEQLTSAALTSGQLQIPEHIILRSLMRGRYRYFNGSSAYISDILSAVDNLTRPSNFLAADILSYLVRNRKEQIDYSQQGYASVATVIKTMSSLGYDEDDAFTALSYLVTEGLVEQDSLIAGQLTLDEAVRAHASGFIHLKLLLTKGEYLIGLTSNMSFSSRQVAERIGSIWAGLGDKMDLSLRSKLEVAIILKDYFINEYVRRCNLHAFYEEGGHGGRAIVAAVTNLVDELERVIVKATGRRTSP